MAYGESNGHVTLKGQTRDPNTLRSQYLKNIWRCYLATTANYYLVCCEAVRSAILAIAWLLVNGLRTKSLLPAHTCSQVGMHR